MDERYLSLGGLYAQGAALCAGRVFRRKGWISEEIEGMMNTVLNPKPTTKWNSSQKCLRPPRGEIGTTSVRPDLLITSPRGGGMTDILIIQ